MTTQEARVLCKSNVIEDIKPKFVSLQSARLHQLKLYQEKIKRLAEKDLFTFFKYYAWPVLQPATPFVDNWHIHEMCDHLQAVHNGEIKRLLISLPFRMLKSTLVSQTFPAWEWIEAPSIQYLTSSYARDVATRDAVESRRIIESDKYGRAWGNRFMLTSDQNVKTRYDNDKRGTRTVTSTDSAGTGFGGNRILIDDPVSALQADSATEIAKSVEWWKGTASTRLNNPQEDTIIVVHQRLNKSDLTGYILAEEKGWDHLVLPMRYDPELRKTTSIGFSDPRKKKGELLFPKRLGEEIVSEMESRLGAYHTSAQLQQNPSSREGTILERRHWKFYHAPSEQMAEDMDEIIWSWDMSFKDLKTSDFVAGIAIGRKGANKYWLAHVNEKLSFSQSKSRVLNERVKFERRTIATLVEDKANGTAIIDSLKDDVPGMIAVNPRGGKTARAYAVQPQHEAGNFYLPSPTMEGYEWVNQIIEIFAQFPDVKNDDLVDAWTQGITWLTTRDNYEAPSAAPATGGYREY